MVDIYDYLIEQDGKDWGTLLTGWAPPLPEEFTIWMVNRFGDLFVVLEDGSVHMLDVECRELKRLADSRNDFSTGIGESDNANLWLLMTLTDACVAAGMTLGMDQCYGLKIPSVLGGKYEIANIAPIDLAVHYSFLADIHNQVKDLPDGSRARFIVKK